MNRPSALLATIFIGLAGCAAQVDRAPAAAPPSGPTFAEFEGKWLDELASADPRLDARVRRPRTSLRENAAFVALIHGDESLDVLRDYPFDFDLRQKRLRALRAELEGAREDDPAAKEERTILAHVLDEEDDRLTRERELPGSATVLVRAVTETWAPPATTAEAASRDHAIAKWLDAVSASLAKAPLPLIRAHVLEDALDPLERLTAGYPETTPALVRVRVALEQAPAQMAEPEGQARLSRDLELYLGVREDLAALATRLSDELALLGREAKAASDAHEPGARVPPPARALPPSLARALGPPPERAEIGAVLDEAGSPVKLHDVVARGIWALDLATKGGDVDATRVAHPLLVGGVGDAGHRIATGVLEQPLPAIAAGIAVLMLDQDGSEHRVERAAAWRALGDAPFDAILPLLPR